MSGSRRSGWLTVALLVAVVLAGWFLDGRRFFSPPRLGAAPPLAYTAMDGPCGHWSILAGQGQTQMDSLSLYTDGVVRWLPCEEGTILSLRGTLARGLGPWVVVESVDGVVFAGYLGSIPVEVDVAGLVWLTFSNDLDVGGEDRNVHALAR